MIYNRKIKLLCSREQGILLDSQSKMCNWLYNQLFTLVEEEYKNGNQKKPLKGRNLRNLVPVIKEKHPFLYTVHSSPLKNTALRLKDAYERWFDKTLDNQKPHYRSWKKKWFSLFYDEPNKGFKLIDEQTLQISFGKKSDEAFAEEKKVNKKAKKQLGITVQLKEALILENEIIKTLRITKDLDSYYAIFTLEKVKVPDKVEEKSFIAFDPNHKNLAVGIGSDGKSYEIKSLASLLKYWDLRIDALKSKRDKCVKKAKLVKTPYSEYWEPSKRWKKLNYRLEQAYLKRREQIKSLLYAYAHYFSKKYDLILIGDYTPTVDVAKHSNMRRAMLNQTPIGQFRSTLEWVQAKNNKHYIKIDERDTTKICCLCGHKEKKNPSIRIFSCKNCGERLSRDLNSAVNIAKKAKKLLPRTGYVGMEHPMYAVWWNWKHSRVACGKYHPADSGK